MESLTGYQHPWGTCDWGECDEPATEWRLSEAHLMHLPVCERHSTDTELTNAQTRIRQLEGRFESLRNQIDFVPGESVRALRKALEEIAALEIDAENWHRGPTIAAEALAAIGGEQ